MEETTEQAVSDLSPIGGSDQPAISSDSTTESDVSGESQSDTLAPVTQDEDAALAGVPSLEELEANQHLPYGKALKQIRSAYEALKPQLETLQPQYERVKAFEPLAEKGLTPDEVQSALEHYEKLTTLGYDEKGVPVRDTSGFVELISKDPDVLEDLQFRLLSQKNPAGVPVGHALALDIIRQNGLDPSRLGDYVLRDEVQASAYQGDVNAEILKQIPAQLQAAYRSFSKAERDVIDNAFGEYALESDKVAAYSFMRDRAEKLADQAERQQYEQQQQQAFEQSIFEAAEQKETEIRATAFSNLYNAVKDVQFSTNPQENAMMQMMVMSPLLVSTFPFLRAHFEPMLEAAGVKLQDMDTILESTTLSAHEWAKLEKYAEKNKSLTNDALKKKTAAMQGMDRITAKLAPVQARLIKLLSSMKANHAQVEGQNLQTAQDTRPLFNGQVPNNNPTDRILPEGMRPGSPEARDYLWKMTMGQSA